VQVDHPAHLFSPSPLGTLETNFKKKKKENPCQNTNKVYDFLQRNSKDQKPTLSFLQSNHLLSCSVDDETMI